MGVGEMRMGQAPLTSIPTVLTGNPEPSGYRGSSRYDILWS